MPEKKKIPRILTLDIMRGFFLIAIFMNHVNFFPNFLDWWGMRGQLLVTTAEGFFLVSGIVLGIVRGAKLIDEPFKKVAKIVLQRALTLYLTYIVLVVAFTLIGWYIFAGNPNIKSGIMSSMSWIQLLWETMTFQYTYGWADYLRFYAIYIAIAPLALWLLRRGMWYVVMAASLGVWFLSPIDHYNMSWTTIQLWQPLPWQLIFFTGLVIGFHWPQITEWVDKHKRPLRKYVIPSLLAVALTTFAINVFAVFAKEFVMTPWTQAISDGARELRQNEFYKEALPMGRYLLFLLWFWAAYILLFRFEKTVIKYTGWLLLPFGMNSLYVYTLQAVIVYFIHIYFVNSGPIFNFVLTACGIGLIYFAIRTKFLMNIIPR